MAVFFDTILPAARMTCLARRISDGRMLHLLKRWLKVPVAEPDARGAQRMSGGKRATRGTPQGGVVSPLVANIYMHRYIKAFRRYGLDRKYGAQLVTYADDLVVLCRHGAHEILEKTRGWMGSMGLALNEGKTCVRDARCEPFDFLGYTFGPTYSPRTGGRYNGARPSKKAIASIKGAIRQRLRNGNHVDWPCTAHSHSSWHRGERLQAVQALARWGGADVRACLLELLKDPAPEIRTAAAKWLGWRGNSTAIAALKERVTDKTEQGRCGDGRQRPLRIGDTSVRPLILVASGDSDPHVREEAMRALVGGPMDSASDLCQPAGLINETPASPNS